MPFETIGGTSPWKGEGTNPGRDSVDCVGNEQSRTMQEQLSRDAAVEPTGTYLRRVSKGKAASPSTAILRRRVKKLIWQGTSIDMPSGRPTNDVKTNYFKRMRAIMVQRFEGLGDDAPTYNIATQAKLVYFVLYTHLFRSYHVPSCPLPR